MKTSSSAIDKICLFEGLKTKAYICPAGILTIGFGHTGSDVKAGMTISSVEAKRLLMDDLAKFEEGVRAAVRVKLSQDQFDALVSFAFNLGLGTLKTSTLLRLLNDAKYDLAAKEFIRWNHAKVNGKMVELDGLTKRRLWEAQLFGLKIP